MLLYLQAMTEEHDTYVPGVCNIGKREVARRRNAFILAIIATIVWATLLFYFQLDKVFRLSLIIPTMALGVTFQQWYNRFCIAYAYWGVFNFKDITKPDKVKKDDWKQKDLAKARGILFASFVYALIITLTAYYVK